MRRPIEVLFIFLVSEIRLTRARDSEVDDASDDDVPSTSGRPISESGLYLSPLKDANVVLN